MFTTTFPRRLMVGSVAALATLVAAPTSTSAARDLFFEETAGAFWAVPHQCANGATVEGTLLVQSTRDFEAPETEDPEPTVRLQFLAVCPDGTSFSWGAGAVPATITSTSDLKSVTVEGSATARDNLGVSHTVDFGVAWTGVGSLETTVNGPGSKRKEREATAAGHVTFDGVLIADGVANHPTRPAPFIRVDTEK